MFLVQVFQDIIFSQPPTMDPCLDFNRKVSLKLKIITFNKVQLPITCHLVRPSWPVHRQVTLLKPLVKVEVSLLNQIRFNRAPSPLVQA